MKVLVADDDRVVPQMLCEMLRARGYSPLPAYDAMQTVMLAIRTPLAAILLDVGMPGGTGVEALRKIKQSTKSNRVPVIVVTGTADKATEEELRTLGVVAVVRKPVDPDALMGLLEEKVGAPPSK